MISIIIPFDNTKYLKRCVKSIIDNKYNDIEIILINDNIDFNDEEIIKMANAKYYKTTEETIGVGNARNLGIKNATGEYIMFVDVDDTINENLLSNVKEYIDEKIEMIKYKMKIIRENKEYLTDEVSFEITDGETGFNNLCFKDKYLDSPCLYIIKKELFERTNLKFEKDVYHEDFGLIPQLIINAKSIVAINYYGYNYYQTEQSIMRNNDYSKDIKKVEDKIKLYEFLQKNIDKYKISNKTKSNMINFYINSIITAIGKLKKENRTYFIKILKKKRIVHKSIVRDLIARDLIQVIKKIIICINMEIYFKWQR